jgi:hypothetical protein
VTAPHHLISDDDLLVLAREAADRVFDDPDADSDYEPGDSVTAATAVARLAPIVHGL